MGKRDCALELDKPEGCAAASQCQGLQLDYANRAVWIDGMVVPSHLSRREFKLLAFLALHAGTICSRVETSEAVYGEPYNAARDDGRLDALVARTRARIGDNPRKPRFLQTKRRVGHCLCEYAGPIAHT